MSKSRAKAPATPSVKKRLVALLRADHKAGNLVRTRNRRVSREHYAELLGCHPHYLGKVAAEEFKRYDQSYAEDLLVEATLFLEAATANKTLRTRDKQINRTWLLDALNAPQRSMTLWPRFRELVESYDQKIADGQYVTPKSESLDLRFTKLLNSPQRPLGKDGCWRRPNFEPPRRSNIEPGVEADFERVGCG